MKIKLLAFLLLLSSLTLFSQPAERMVKVLVTPDQPEWTYAVGQKVKFDVRVTKNNIPVNNVEIRYELSYDMMEPFKKETLVLKEGKLTVDAGTMKTAGFLRCRVFVKLDGYDYEGRATAGFAPEAIQPTTTLPADFWEFWDKAKNESAKIPMDARLRLLPERCTAKANVYELNIQNYRNNSRIYGILCVPKAPGKYPAKLKVPGAGVRPYGGLVSDAEKGIITLEIGIHGIPVTMDSYVYENLQSSALMGYQYQNWDNRENVYYKRVYMGCVRAIDYIFSMEEFDGENVVVCGGSQGGALAIITAALDSRIKGLAAFYPALSDITGYANKRAGGWPHMFRSNSGDSPEVLAKKIETSKYYDVVNFARFVKVPGFYSFGFNDMVCPPTSTYSAYNVITAPKTFMLVQEIAHYTYPEQWGKANRFMDDLLGVK